MQRLSCAPHPLTGRQLSPRYHCHDREAGGSMNSAATGREAPPLGGRVVLRQRWSEVSFLHWQVDPNVVEPYMPAGCRPDVIDGSTWVGLIAFQMSKSSFFGGPRIPWLGDFPEVNVRLYSIDEHGQRGVVFLSLEASHLIPVLVARAAFSLKYQWAAMTIGHGDGTIEYRTRRHGKPGAACGTRLCHPRAQSSSPPTDTSS